MSIILLTYQCDKQCNYCNCWTREKTTLRELNLELLNKLKYIITRLITRNGEKIVISGGEPGILNQDYLDKFFSIFPYKVAHIYTNGLFIKNGYSKRYADKIAFHTVHICDDEENLPIINHNCRYVYTVNHTNVNKLPEISKLYKNITIYIELFDDTRGNDSLRLDTNDLLTIDDMCTKYNNLNFKFSKTNLSSDTKLLKKYIEPCRKYPFFMEIDLPNNTINYCCNSNIKNLAITTDNCDNLFNEEFVQKTLDINRCYNCSVINNKGQIYFNRMIKTILEKHNNL